MNQVEGAERPSMVVSTLKAALAIGFFSLAAASALSSKLDQAALSQRSPSGARALEDPVATGALARAAAGQRLDPCAVAPKG